MSDKHKKTFKFESDVAYTPKVEVTLGEEDGARTVTVIKISTDDIGEFTFSGTSKYIMLEALGSGEQSGILESFKTIVAIMETHGLNRRK